MISILKNFFSSHFNCSIQVQFSPKTRKYECTLKECCRKLFSIHFLDKIGQNLKSFICNTSYSTVILTRPSSSNTIRQVHCVNNSYSIVKDSSADLGVNFKIVQNRPTVKAVCTKISKKLLSIFVNIFIFLRENKEVSIFIFWIFKLKEP